MRSRDARTRTHRSSGDRIRATRALARALLSDVARARVTLEAGHPEKTNAKSANHDQAKGDSTQDSTHSDGFHCFVNTKDHHWGVAHRHRATRANRRRVIIAREDVAQ